jgi:16S rRNA (adenine1518-N6/adenine1519-N6)-dimethyltransferase
MCETGEVSKKDTVLEIGPGKGALTEKLLEKSGKVIAVEKDRDLILILEEKFRTQIDTGNLVLVQGDILEFDAKKYNLINNEYKIIANIPYNITGAIFKKFLSEEIQPSKMVILVQKEVAMRIVANDKKESILSLSVKAYGTPKYIMKVNKRFFSPAPKVDSAIIAISNISKLNFKDKKTESNFFNLIKTGFGHKRKVLKKNLELIIPKDAIEKSFLNLKIDPKSRAEDLPLDIWLKLTKSVDTSIGNL